MNLGQALQTFKTHPTLTIKRGDTMTLWKHDMNGEFIAIDPSGKIIARKGWCQMLDFISQYNQSINQKEL